MGLRRCLGDWLSSDGGSVDKIQVRTRVQILSTYVLKRKEGSGVVMNAFNLDRGRRISMNLKPSLVCRMSFRAARDM